jgi:LPS-assembly lipoprotein
MKFLAILAIMFLSACGFSPVYGTKSPSQALNQVKISAIPDRSGQVVRNHLIDQFYQDGYPTDPRYALSVSQIIENIVEIGIDKDDEASRSQLRLSATMRLVETETNKMVLERTVRATSGYNILAGQFTTFVTEQDARQQALKAIAEDIQAQLELYFNR